MPIPFFLDLAVLLHLTVTLFSNLLPLFLIPAAVSACELELHTSFLVSYLFEC